MSGIRGLPHQIIAVYRHMLPQTRLRFVLADDPGAGKTIMAGLLMKELQLRGVADRVLILCPAPLVPQWQDELAEKFDEHFEIFDSRIRWAPGGNPWQRHNRVIASVDFAKRDEIMQDLLRADWDLVVIDEAHKCSATFRWDPQEQRDRLDRTQRYRLAEQISGACERLLLMTATPHSGDPTRFQNFLKLLDPDQFAIEELSREQIAREDSPYFLRRQKEDLKDERGADLFVPSGSPHPAVRSDPAGASSLRGGDRVHPRVPRPAAGSQGRRGRAGADRPAAAARLQPRGDPLVARQAGEANRRADRGDRGHCRWASVSRSSPSCGSSPSWRTRSWSPKTRPRRARTSPRKGSWSRRPSTRCAPRSSSWRGWSIWPIGRSKPARRRSSRRCRTASSGLSSPSCATGAASC